MLLVIDIQDFFRSSSKVADKIYKQIQRSKKNRERIIFLEYMDCRRTTKKLRTAVKNYSNKAFVKKIGDDGSYELVRHLKKTKFKPREIKVCGVNTDACVRRTVTGLTYKIDIPIRIISNLCADGTIFAHKEGLKDMKTLRNVKIS